MRPPAEHPTNAWIRRHDAILDAILEHGRRYPYVLTLREIANATGLAASTVHNHVQGLAAEKRITYTPGTARSICPKRR